MLINIQAGKKRIRNAPLGGSGSGSDVDIGAGSGGELSESGKTKKLRLNPPSATSRSGTPQGSRATSPIGGAQFPGSRAASPDGPRGKFLPWIHIELYVLQDLITLYSKQAPVVPPPSHPANHSPRRPKSTPPFQQPVSPAPTFYAFSGPALASRGRTTVVSLPSSRMLVFMARRTGCCDLVRGSQLECRAFGESVFHCNW